MRIKWVRMGFGIAAVIVAPLALGQSANIDLNSFASPPLLGGGAPTSLFGGGANQPGFWNSISVSGFGPEFMRTLDGTLTSVQVIGPGGGIGGGFNNPLNTGDFALLLNDARDLSPLAEPLNFHFDGLLNGRYKLFTYSVLTFGGATTTFITITASSTSVTRTTSGSMPGNSFINGVTNTVHEFDVTNHRFDVRMVGTMGMNSQLNGMQLVLIPEPSSLLGISSLVALFAAKRARRLTTRLS